MKLKTKIIHSFEIEEDLMDDIGFTFDLLEKDIKRKSKIVVEKKKTKIKSDASTRLF